MTKESEIMKKLEDRRPKTKDQSIKFKVQSQNSQVIKTSTLVDQTVSPLGDVRRTGIHLLFVGNGELEESLKLKSSLAISGDGLAEKEVESSKLKEVESLAEDKAQGLGVSGEALVDEGLKVKGKRFEEYITQDKHPNLISHISHLITKNVHFMDFQNQLQMPVVYQACDLFCLPSLSETWGLAVNEAMASGKAVLISDKVGCGIDLVTNGKNGYIFESENESDLQSKLITMCANKDLLRNMGKASLAKIASWSFDNQVTAIKTELDKI
ncbi:glycosyltransferase [Pedobacter changchengzhani]|uniref:Glycosyltransferase n=2 Tax=Pedobacter changchengzhani TaxID=2529274 RepID=A0A4R5MIE6_9SPHI|nr:glycosyltransferase [Pedobacter changchengzhani]